MESPTTNSNLSIIIYAATLISLILFMYLNKFPAPYGKFIRTRGVFCSIFINSTLAWVVQECPAFIVPFHVLCKKWASLSWISILALIMFCLHYFNRSFIYPLRIKSKKKTPLETCISAFVFCSFNGWLQSRCIIENNLSHKVTLFSFIGTLLFFVGMYINISSDTHLIELASQRIGNQYLLPHKGMFKYVSAANYFGEIVEWLGFLLFIKTLGAAWFSLFTILFLGQRGYQTHKFYKEKIANYPKHRSSVFPFSGF